jgi:hypothetical protein
VKFLISVWLLLLAVSARAQSIEQIQDNLARQAMQSAIQQSPVLQCIAPLEAQAAISDVLLTLGVPKLTVMASPTRLTPIQLTNYAHASPKDSAAMAAYVSGLVACGLPADSPLMRVLRPFAAGIFTYSETSLLYARAVTGIPK